MQRTVPELPVRPQTELAGAENPHGYPRPTIIQGTLPKERLLVHFRQLLLELAVEAWLGQQSDSRPAGPTGPGERLLSQGTAEHWGGKRGQR